MDVEDAGVLRLAESRSGQAKDMTALQPAKTQRYVAFLRGINLGKRRISMDRLKAFFGEMGLEDVETFIASGNVIFSSPLKASKLEPIIAMKLKDLLGYEVDTFVRTSAEVSAVGGAKVFPEEGQDGITIHVGFLHRKLPVEVARQLEAVRTSEDEFRVIGREFYWLCQVRTSDSKVWTLPVVKALRLPTCTMRNLKSVRKLIAQRL